MDRRGIFGGMLGLGVASLWASRLQAAGGLHHPPRAKRVIFLFMAGGPSHVDLFDPKPELKKRAGQPLPFAQPKLIRTQTTTLLPSPFAFQQHGKSGAWISELMPHLAKQADRICFLRGMHADNINHNGACLQMNTGEQAFSRPSLGSWLSYGLGTENQNLPSFVVLSPAQPAQGAPLWSSSFLPASHQGTLVQNFSKPIENLAPASATQRQQLDVLKQLNEDHAKERAARNLLQSRMESFELAFRMQAEAPQAFDLAQETQATLTRYGVGPAATDIFAKQCLLARRLIERNVRMVQVYHTQTHLRSSCQLWDQHGGLRTELRNNCLATDQPIAALLADLAERGLLNDTLVVWGGEFGRTPTAEGPDGREHHPFGFTMWLAGGGIKPGLSYGQTDEFGWHAAENKMHVHDLHATILHQMGIDHEKLTVRHAGRDYRLTDVHGHVVKAIIS
ncbi:MAG: DUF1501 domain-containing protein [Gemmataceae bacterium]